MPQTKSAKKALRVDRRRALVNKLVRERMRKALQAAKKVLSASKLIEAQRGLDQAVKKGIIHKNKASRLKSRLIKAAKKATLEQKVKAWEKTHRKIAKKK